MAKICVVLRDVPDVPKALLDAQAGNKEAMVVVKREAAASLSESSSKRARA